MNKQIKTLGQLKKADKLVNRTFHKNGPKSFKKGQGALIKVLHHQSDGQLSSRELIGILNFNRGELKRVVRKAQRNGYVEINESSEERTYIVSLTELGKELADKRCKAHSKVADAIMEALTDEEIEQLNELTDKIIMSCKGLGAHGKHRNTSCKQYRHHAKSHCKCA